MHLASTPVSYVSPDTERFSLPGVNLTAKRQGDALLNVGLAARILLSHGPGSNQKSSRGGLNQCRETGDTRLEQNHDGKEKRRGVNGAALSVSILTFPKRGEKGDREITLRTRNVGRAIFTRSGQAFIYSSTQEAFIMHLLCVDHQAGW